MGKKFPKKKSEKFLKNISYRKHIIISKKIDQEINFENFRIILEILYNRPAKNNPGFWVSIFLVLDKF